MWRVLWSAGTPTCVTSAVSFAVFLCLTSVYSRIPIKTFKTLNSKFVDETLVFNFCKGPYGFR
jgi:hypothetical protein